MADEDFVETDSGIALESVSTIPTDKTDSDSGRGIDYNRGALTSYFLDDGSWGLVPPYDFKVKTKVGDVLDENGDIMSNFFMTQFDRLPVFEGQVVDQNGIVDLTGKTAKLIMSKDSVTIVDAACTLISAAQGRVSYAWAEGDTDLSGIHKAVIEVTDGSLTQSFPSYRPILINIQESPRIPVVEEEEP